MKKHNKKLRHPEETDISPTNGQRADYAEIGLKAYLKGCGDGPDEANIRDLIANLLHLAHRQGLDPSEEVHAALRDWAEEARIPQAKPKKEKARPFTCGEVRYFKMPKEIQAEIADHLNESDAFVWNWTMQWMPAGRIKSRSEISEMQGSKEFRGWYKKLLAAVEGYRGDVAFYPEDL